MQMINVIQVLRFIWNSHKQQVYIDTAQHLEMIILSMYTCFKLQIK